MVDNGEAQQPAYRAFISYSHADAKFAGWLHRKIEGFRLPVRGPGEALPKLAPVFIDRAELAAASDLTSAVRQAIANSAVLIVIASPAARASKWVAQEIELFRELHPDRPILTALCEGEPGEAFPYPLLVRDGSQVEPLAADFRKGHDGPRLGLLKLVAGLTGQPLDRLVQRDAQKRQLRVIAITAAASVLILVLSALLVMAIKARNEAERQRAEAEGMVEFMLTDLRDRLKGVGRLDVMESVNERAMKHYAGQDLSSLPDDSLTRRARLLHAMGEDDQTRSDFASAKVKYWEAHRLTEAVLARRPKDPEAIFAHAQSEYWVGAVERDQRNYTAVAARMQKYLDLAKALEKVQPGTVRTYMELGYGHGNLCEEDMRFAKPPQQLSTHCLEAVAAEQKALALDPENRSTLLEIANRLGWIAGHLDKLERYEEGNAYRRQEAEIVDRLIRLDPLNLEYRDHRQFPELGTGIALVRLKRHAEAERVLTSSDAELLALEQAMPGNTTITVRRMRTAWWLARNALEGRLANAAQRLATARAQFERIKRLTNSKEVAHWTKYMQQLDEMEKSYGR